MTVMKPNLFNRSGGQCRALVVDDHEINRRVLGAVLAGSGANVVQADNGHEACDLAEMMEFDVILMDLEMPFVDGLTAIRRIRAREVAEGRNRTPIIVVSAFNTSKDVAASSGAGADGHFEKPVRILSLLEAIQEVLATFGESLSTPSRSSFGSDALSLHAGL
jgi:CheY-like chemotaxis protein